MSFRVSKVLFNRKIFKILSNKSCLLSSSKLMSQTVIQNIGQDAEVSKKKNDFFLNEEKLCCRKFLENQTSSPIPWESLEQKLTAMKSANIRSIILKSCQLLKRGDLAVNYCQYLIDKGEKLSLIEICLLIRVLPKCRNDVKNCDKLLKTIYEHSHDTIFSLEVIVKEAVEVFCKNKSCFEDLILKYKKGEIHAAGIEKLIAAAFDVGDLELAWKIAKENPEKFLHSSVKSYLKFCIRQAEENKFSVDLLSDLINFCKTYTVILKDDSFFDNINQLVAVLNKSETKEYFWIATKCDIIKTNLCSSCQYKFKLATITTEELEELKKNFLKKVMICYDINMKTTPQELKNFFIFLENCRPYDIVIDVLNVFKGSHHKKVSVEKILSYFTNQGMEILLIARHHFKNSELYNKVKEKFQIFLTRNDSLDDIFCLYATMHQGLNTYFCTSDFLRDHAKFFDNHSLNALFHKWQISHQYMIHLSDQKILQPRHHSDIPQSSVVLDRNNKVKEYYWHLTYSEFGCQYRVEMPAKWICLKAKSLIYQRKQLKRKPAVK